MHVVTVEFTLREGFEDAFLARVAQQAADSLRLEPGCRTFEVARGTGAPHVVHLYEEYDDAPAFEAHLASDHFRAFDAEIVAMVADKRVRRWEAVSPSPTPP